MQRKKKSYYWGLVYIMLIISCQVDKTQETTSHTNTGIVILEKNQTDYQLQSFIQLLEEPAAKYTIQDITQATLQTKFQTYPNHTLDIQNYKYYWGKVQIKNRLTNAEAYTEWILSFSNTWTSLEVFKEAEDGSWQQEQNGTFTPDRLKGFAPTARGNLVKISLPPQEIVTFYFRGISERTAIYPSFYLRLQHIETFYNRLIETKASNALFMGFLLMMFLYNLILYFYGRDRSFLFYSGYLIMMVIYASYLSDDFTDWFGDILFPFHPQYSLFLKLSIYLGLMCYLAFIRSFLDLEQLLPKWDKFFKVVIYLGFPIIVLDVTLLLLSNFSYVVEDKVTVFYILMAIFSLCALPYPLFKTKDKKGYFIIGGIAALAVGAFLTIILLLVFPPFTLFYLKAGTIIEILIFSLGLAYRQRQQKVAQQRAAFELKESQLIQEKKQMEANRLQELNDFKARFYTNITHEFRTPLTVIMGMSENLKNNPQEKRLIQRNSQNLLRLINQLLNLSKLESGTLKLNKVHQDIIVYLQYLTESFYSAATQKEIRLVFHSEEKEVLMDFDEERIQQIVYNLLSNALKFTPKVGKVIFHASTIEENGQPFLKLKIKDTGRGISSENITHIFDRFYQVNSENSNPQEGTGIGLALTKELVEFMEGRIEVESQLGEGTEFILYLPIESKVRAIIEKNKARKVDSPTARELDSMSRQEAIKEEEPSSVPSFPELLIIEDNPDIIIYIKTILKNKYNIHTAKNGALGIEKALDIIPDIIISDVMMPEKNGYEVCDILKQDERSSHIPIILLTAKATQTDKVAGLKHGADAYLMKPFDKAELLVRLEKLLEVRRDLQQKYSSKDVTGLEDLSRLTPEDIFIQKLQKHIDTHLSDTRFGVDQLATINQMSQMQLYRKLKALTGKTPSQFIRSYRLQKGLERLQKGQFTISEVAYDVGFADPSYFSRVFQKEFGKSPSDFIR